MPTKGRGTTDDVATPFTLQLCNSNLKLFDFLVVNDSNKVFGEKMVETDVFCWSIFDIASSRGLNGLVCVHWACWGEFKL